MWPKAVLIFDNLAREPLACALGVRRGSAAIDGPAVALLQAARRSVTMGKCRRPRTERGTIKGTADETSTVSRTSPKTVETVTTSARVNDSHKVVRELENGSETGEGSSVDKIDHRSENVTKRTAERITNLGEDQYTVKSSTKEKTILSTKETEQRTLHDGVDKLTSHDSRRERNFNGKETETTHRQTGDELDYTNYTIDLVATRKSKAVSTETQKGILPQTGTCPECS